jgi:hypothetical protein
MDAANADLISNSGDREDSINRLNEFFLEPPPQIRNADDPTDAAWIKQAWFALDHITRHERRKGTAHRPTPSASALCFGRSILTWPVLLRCRSPRVPACCV